MRLRSYCLVVGSSLLLAVASLSFPAGCASTGDPIQDENGSSSSSSGVGGQNTSTAAGGAGGEACSDQELCDGIDNNCNDQVDEGCSCSSGDTQSCYSGPAELEGIGACAAGLQTCDELGHWGECEGEVLPSEEVCDGADNDCNEKVDEDLGTVTCGLGICKVTVDACENGMTVPCIPGTPDPAGETCNGVDDDCDGDIDEGCNCIDEQVQPCYGGSAETQGVGECKDGTQTCTNGTWGACVNDVTPTSEVCDGKDNDCDKSTDEGDPGGGGVCSTGKLGVCAVGTMHCTGGALICSQDVPSSNEKCNGLDDDCDGDQDEGNPDGGGACDTGALGKCKAGTFICSNGGLSCVQNQQSSSELCNGIDDDCDGDLDEGNPEGGGPCNTGLSGICAAGTDLCQGGQLICKQTNPAVPEQCNNLDDDCDKAVDEGNPGGGGICSTGLFGVCAVGTDLCQGGQIICSQNVQSSSEKCNNLDDDCDNSVDEGDPEGGVPCVTGLFGVCSPGTKHCSGGQLNCVANASPSSETCNGLDDDCDNSTDEGNPGGGGSCNTGLFGVCGPGTENCSGGQIVCTANQQSSPEQCNNLDDDCDNSVDEGNPGGGNSCNTNLQGVCAAGTMNCVSGSLQCQQNVSSSPENCSDNLDNDCDGLTDSNDPDCACAHPLCTVGTKLTSGCDSNQCVIDICNVDPWCCNNSWDSLCVSRVRTTCDSLTCADSAGSCPSAPCDANGSSTPFTSGCDSGQANCVTSICAADSYCCTFDWDSICVNQVTTVCNMNCTYQ